MNTRVESNSVKGLVVLLNEFKMGHQCEIASKKSSIMLGFLKRSVSSK